MSRTKRFHIASSLVLFAILFTFSNTFAQVPKLFHNGNINIKSSKLFIIGEHHRVQEFYDVQYCIIEHIILHNPNIKNFQLLIENSLCLNYYLDKLILENDSVSLKKILMHHSHRIQDTLFPMNQARYDFYMKFYRLSKLLKGRTFRFNCYDNTLILRSLVFTVLDILKKYSATGTIFLSQISFMDSLLQKEKLDRDYLAFHQQVGACFIENEELLKNILTQNDYYYLFEMMKRLPSINRNPSNIFEPVTQERENMMFKHINNSYNDSTFFFCIIGTWHIRKPYHTSELLPKLKKDGVSKAVSVIEMMEKYRISQFKNKIILCNLVPLIKKFNDSSTDKVFNIPGYYPPALQKHRNYLNSLLTGNITLIDMRKTNIKHAHKITDYLIVVKETNSLH